MRYKIRKIIAGILSLYFAFAPSIAGAAELFTTALFSDANLEAYYRLEGNASSSAGVAGDGTASNITYGSGFGKYGQGASFNGSNSSIISASNSGISGSEARSIGGWFYTTSTTANVAMIGFGNYQAGSAGWTLFLNRDEGGTGAVGTNIAGTGSAYTVSASFATGTWNHVVMNYPSGAGVNGVTFYINCVQVTNQSAQTNVPNTTDTPVYMGVANADTDFGYFPGYLDDLFVFDRELTSGEISTLCAEGGTRKLRGPGITR